MFGSHARGTGTSTSDVDLLIILDTSVMYNKNFFELKLRFKNQLRWLELKFDYNLKPKNMIEQIFEVLRLRTGIFRSWFIIEDKSFINHNIQVIFGVNKFLSKILAPSSIIINNIIQDGKTLYGDNLLASTNIDKFVIANNDKLRSFVINFLLAIGALFLTPFSRKSTLFSIEAIKWSLINNKNIYQEYFQDEIDNIIGLSRYYRIKKENTFDPFLNLIAPLIVWKIHAKNKMIIK